MFKEMNEKSNASPRLLETPITPQQIHPDIDAKVNETISEPLGLSRSKSHSILTPKKDSDIYTLKEILLSSVLRYREARRLQLEKMQTFEWKMKQLRELERKNKAIYNMYCMKVNTLVNRDESVSSLKGPHNIHSMRNLNDASFHKIGDVQRFSDDFPRGESADDHYDSEDEMSASIETSFVNTMKRTKNDKQMGHLMEDWLNSKTTLHELTDELKELSKVISDKKLIFHANKKLAREKAQLNRVALTENQNITKSIEMIVESNSSLKSLNEGLKQQTKTQQKEIQEKKLELESYQSSYKELEEEAEELKGKCNGLQSKIAECASELMVKKMRLETIQTERSEFIVHKINKLRRPLGKIILDRIDDELVMILHMPKGDRVFPISEIEDVEPLTENASKLRILFKDPYYNRYNIFICQNRSLLISTLKDWINYNAKNEARKDLRT